MMASPISINRTRTASKTSPSSRLPRSRCDGGPKWLQQCLRCRCHSTGTSRVRTTKWATREATASARLHEWFVTPEGEFFRPSGLAGELFDEMMHAFGAVLVGRRTAEQIDHWGGDHHGSGVPMFMPSHRSPGPSVANYPLVTYVSDGIASAMAQAKAAAGARNVAVRGAYAAQRALEAGVLDELQVHQIPVLFGGGRRLFEVLPSRVELEIVRVIDTPEVTHIRYRVFR